MVKVQQGDVVLYEVKSIPGGAKKIKSKIVEKGEGSNTHVLEGDCEIYEHEGTIYLKTGEGKSQINHEEHGTQVLEPNTIYKKVIEREFDYENMEARRVVD